MSDALTGIISANRDGQRVALPSVCSANPDVIRASLLLAAELDRPLLVEATSNQVNQFGGYTGMQPADFVAFVQRLATDTGTTGVPLIFGGDHLGPQAWAAEPVETAMTKAEDMIAAYVAAGFTKIHLDCSEPCGGEPGPLDDATVAARAARLARVAEASAPDPSALSYIVGTEVPPPGGARPQHEDGIAPTDPDAARRTIAVHLDTFRADPALAHAATRIVALVVQPGVEFGADSIDHLPPGDNAALTAVLSDHPGWCFEAHSTDYQHPDTFGRLATMGFAIQKVGPALTFAYRQALYALDLAVDLIDGQDRTTPRLREVTEAVMQDKPGYWQSHYPGDPDRQRLLRHYSYSDRIRYYWPEPRIQTAISALTGRFNALAPMDPLLAQVFPPDILARAATVPAKSRADALILAAIQSALLPYFTLPE